jgi:DNA-binding NarL/FixJ family response regulator
MLSDLLTVAAALKAGADAYVLKGNGPEDISCAFNSIFYQKPRFLSPQLRHYFIDENLNKVFQTNNENVSFYDNLITSREKQVLKMICEGLTNEKIAAVLSISIRTVDTHRTNLLTKLKLPNTASLVRFAVENKLID